VLVNKIDGLSHKGYQPCINNNGDLVYAFYYPHDSNNQEVQVEFYRPWSKNGDKPVRTINLKDTNIVDFSKIPEFNNINVIPYRILVNGKHVVDSGFYTDFRNSGNGFNLINRKVSNPITGGQAIQTMIDSQRPGAFYSGFNSEYTGKVNYDINRQRDSEDVIRTASNKGGGSLAGIEYDIDEYFKKMDIQKIFMTPVWGYDPLTSHRYLNQIDTQISDDIGNVDNYETFIRKLYKNGMQYVDDFAITSMGLEGIPVQYALRWAGQNPQTYYWFRMNGLNDGPLGFGVVPKNKVENLRFRVINPPVVYNSETGKVEKNPKYNSNREVIYQIYDVSQVTPEQLTNSNEIIRSYKNIKTEDKLAINDSADTILPHYFEIKPQEYKNRLEEFAKMNKNSSTPIKLDSPEGALFIGQFTNFKISVEGEGAVFWDANPDLLKRNYYISPYDEKLLNAIPNPSERDHLRELIKRGNYEIRDVAIQAGVYRTQLVKDIQLLYNAQMIKNASGKSDIDKLIGNSLPDKARLSTEEIENILGGWYNLSRKGIESKSDVTVRALMKLPVDSLELGDNTIGVLTTSFFTNRAAREEDIGLSRFDYHKQGLGVYTPYDSTFYSFNNLYETKLKDFTYEVINAVNKTSPEKLLKPDGNYTEYGEYVINLLGKDIAKYAFLKAIAGDKLQTKIMSDDILKGKITYNYPELRKITTLKALGINASSPENEAKALLNIISSGLGKLDKKDIKYVAESVSKRIEGTTLNGFRLSEAMVNKSGLGLDLRLDAAKDVADMDSVRNGDLSFDRAWDEVIDFWKKYVQEIKKINPNAYIVAEITDVDQLMRAMYGQDSDVWNSDLSTVGGKYKNVPDAIRAFFSETGVTSESAYSYTFTDLLHLFSADAEYGNIQKDGINSLKNRMQALINTNGLDYIRNIWTFADNPDKPSILHAMALDMELFHTTNLEPDFRDKAESFNNAPYEQRRRNARISVLQEMSNADKFEDLPLELMMNIDNKEYFKTVNTRAVAMSKLIRSAINDRIPNTFDKKNILKQALVDLTNGNYLTNDKNINLQTINIPELQTLDSALDSILKLAGLTLTESEKKSVIEKAKQRERVEKYAVRGDFDWNEGKHWTAIELIDRAKSVLGRSESNYQKYSPYTVSVAALLADSYKEVTKGKNLDIFTKGTRAFVEKYDREAVNKASSPLPYTQENQVIKKQKAYASRDIETVINMVIQQAELKSGKKFSKSDHDYIMKEVFQSATEPAVQKALMYATFLSALPGIPSIYYRDILGALGYDEKAKNVFLQSRNTVKYSQIEEAGPLKEYRTRIFNAFKEVMQIRSKEGLGAINGGTPYLLETNNPDAMAMLYQNSNDDIAITVLNAGGINPHNRVEYDKSIVDDSENAVYTINNNNKYVPKQKRLELNEIILPAFLALTAGMVFVSAIGTDTTEYIVKKTEDGAFRLVRKDGKKIVLNGKNSKWGVMFLKKFFKPSFKGNYLNLSSNIVNNTYKLNESNELGKNLSLISC